MKAYACIVFGFKDIQGDPGSVPWTATMKTEERANQLLNKYLSTATLSFRSVFSKVFQYIFICDSPELKEERLSLDNISVSIESVTLLSSPRHLLDGTEEEDYFLSICVEVENVEEASTFFGALQKKEVGVSGIVKRWSREDRSNPISSSIFRLFSESTLPTGKLHPISFPKKLIADAPIYFAFFHYGWLISIRLERKQKDFTIDQNDEIDKIKREVVDQRKRLINLNRYFLYKSVVTSDSDAVNLYRQLARTENSAYRIEAYYKRLSEVHDLIEKHLTSLIEIAQESSSKKSSRFVAFLTYSSIPLTIFGTLVQVNLDSPMFADPAGSLLDVRFLKLFLICSIPLIAMLAGTLLERDKTPISWSARRKGQYCSRIDDMLASAHRKPVIGEHRTSDQRDDSNKVA